MALDPTTDKTKDKDIEEVEQEEIVHYKLVLTHKNSRGLESTTKDIQRKIESLIKDKNAQIKASGPARIPTKYLHIVTRKSPCGNGTNTFDHFEMRIHKRVFHIHCSQKNLKNIVSDVHTEPGMVLEADEN